MPQGDATSIHAGHGRLAIDATNPEEVRFIVALRIPGDDCHLSGATIRADREYPRSDLGYQNPPKMYVSQAWVSESVGT